MKASPTGDNNKEDSKKLSDESSEHSGSLAPTSQTKAKFPILVVAPKDSGKGRTMFRIRTRKINRNDTSENSYEKSHEER